MNGEWKVRKDLKSQCPLCLHMARYQHTKITRKIFDGCVVWGGKGSGYITLSPQYVQMHNTTITNDRC